MVDGVGDFLPAPGDLALQRGDARLQLRDRQRIEVLPNHLGKQVGGAGEGIVHIHRIGSVDRPPGQVNKRCERTGTRANGFT